MPVNDTPMSQRLDASAERALADKRIVGSVVIALLDGKTVHRKAYGLADRESGTPMRPDQIFRLASITKPLVTAACMRLIEHGRMSLDAAVTDFLPDFKPKLPDGDAPTIRIRHLLTHTAGLSYDFIQPLDGPYTRLKVSAGADQPGLGMEENLARIVEAGLSFPPGAAWLYSVAIDVLGAAMQKADGASLPDIVDRLVARPLGMKDTSFRVTDASRLATPYADGKPEPVKVTENHKIPFIPGMAPITACPSRAFDPSSFPAGGSGMNGVADEIALFLDTVRAGGGPILNEASTRAMMSNQIGELRVFLDPTKSRAFGFGGSVLVSPEISMSPQSLGTWQWGGVWGHSWFVDPVRKLTLVTLTNTALEGMAGQYVRDNVAAAYGVG